MTKSVLAAGVFLVLAMQPVYSQAFPCGEPPSLTPLGKSAESVKGQLQGQANVLLKLVGKAQLAGAVEAARSTIYNEPGAYYAAQKDAYLSYIFCSIVSSDKDLPSADKIKALEAFRTPVSDLNTASEGSKNESQMVTTTCIKSSDNLPSGACSSWSDWYSLCSEYQPTDWKLVSSSFQLTGDRACGRWAECNRTQETTKRVCHQFRMMGHNEECGRASNTGIKLSRGILQTTWLHPKGSRSGSSDGSCNTN